mmetsp:Transcript_17692/g.38443  ORF Transcript_17692/g.38443 Transcript_17692/m.38443 type:complete len:81 (+) Transcript_17692:2190-2432(+)
MKLFWCRDYGLHWFVFGQDCLCRPSIGQIEVPTRPVVLSTKANWPCILVPVGIFLSSRLASSMASPSSLSSSPTPPPSYP